jgi:putative ABC transport system permease protein
MTIVGVVGDVAHFGPGKPEEPAVYDLYSQMSQPWKRWSWVVARSAADPGDLVREVTAKIREIDPQLPPTKIRTMTEVVAGSTTSQKFDLVLLGVFALVALALASIGVYGLIAYTVAQQRHDIGVRMALGADAAAIVRLVVVGGLKLAAAGAVLGIVGALFATRLMKSLLFGVGARDPYTLAAVAAILALVALVASWIPARAATRADPIAALREE